MKKKAFCIVAVVLFIGSIVLSSCGASEKCPAYSKADTEQNAKNI